jgi:hypothetical protein
MNKLTAYCARLAQVWIDDQDQNSLAWLLLLLRESTLQLPSYIVAEIIHRILPQPTYAPAVSDDEDDVQQFAPSQSLISRTTVPPYGQRPGWKPASPEDFGKLD